MMSVEERPGWMDDAACFGADPDLFFPQSRYGKPGPYQTHVSAEAIAVCAGCEVRNECLTHALTHGETLGIWGGLTAAERRRLTRRHPAAGALVSLSRGGGAHGR